MPIYEFSCKACGRVADHIVSVGEDGSSLTCPHCGGDELVKCHSVPAVHTSHARSAGETCCNRDERCETPPCAHRGPCCH